MAAQAAAHFRDGGGSRANHFLAALSDPARSAVPSADVAIVVAHPDDETVGCGGQMPRLRDASLLLVTDGAPEDLGDAHAHGFATAAHYADARARELEAAMELAGLPREALRRLGFGDQTAAFSLAELSRALAGVFRERGTRFALTHAYEGGHPDHDATAFAVHAAARLLAREGRPVEIVEMPLYHAGPNGWAVQRFCRGLGVPATEIVLSDDERARKRAMIAAHATQSATLANFACDVERFRPAPAYDFGQLPNGGALLYERYGWGMTGERWLALADAASAELGLRGAP